ncbi:MAG: hypothetical protein JXB08_02485 [Bacilli bacterium]|nr:hypothetical protein [Bacilli bacterium]
MDSWFEELFEIVKKQTETIKMDRLLPKVYLEFDVLVRKNNLGELRNIHRFLKEEHPIHTEDSEYNIKKEQECLKEVLYRTVLLDDYSTLDEDLDEILESGDGNLMEEFLAQWQDMHVIYDYVLAYFESGMSGKAKDPEPEPIIESEEHMSLQDLLKELDEEPEATPEPEEIIQPSQEVPLEEPKPKKAKKPKPTEPKDTTFEEDFLSTGETVKEPIPVPKQEPEPVKKSLFKKIVEPKPEPIESQESPIDTDFFDFFDMVMKSYPNTISKEKLQELPDPKPTFIRLFLEHIDSEEHSAAFFHELIAFFDKLGYSDMADFITDHSKMLEKCATVNIGLLHNEHTDQIKQLLDSMRTTLSKNLVNTKLEITLSFFIQSLGEEDKITRSIRQLSEKISVNAPYQIETHEATGAIEFFLNHILLKPGRDFKADKLPQLYWSIILAASLGIYVIRRNASDYQTLIDYIQVAGIHLYNLLEVESLKETTRQLALHYIRTMHKCALSGPHYASWWTRQVDDLLDAKLSAISKFNEIDAVS